VCDIENCSLDIKTFSLEAMGIACIESYRTLKAVID